MLEFLDAYRTIKNARNPRIENFILFNMGIGMNKFVSKDLKGDIIENLGKKKIE